MLAGCILLIALVLAPFAAGRSGANGLAGVAAAAGICLVTGLAAEGVATLLAGRVSTLVGMLLGMAIRMVPPLGACVFLAAQGSQGRHYLPFIVYLLAFYFVTLALETWLTVERIGSAKGSREPRNC